MVVRQSENLTRQIARELGEKIVGGGYAVNSILPFESELCHEFGASRTVVREAVKMLTAKGLLSARPKRGTHVRPENEWNLLDPDVLQWMLGRNFSLDLLQHFTETRLGVEPIAAKLAAENATADAKLAIRAALARMEAAARGEDDPLESDIAFHIRILEASGNPFLNCFGPVVDTALRFSIRFTNRAKGVKVASIPAHRQICDAILDGDPGTAETHVVKLLRDALELIKREKKKRSTGSEGKSKPNRVN